MRRILLAAAVLHAALAAQTPNGACATAQLVAAGVTYASNAGDLAPLDGGPVPSCDLNAARDVWFAYVPTSTGVHIVGTCPVPGGAAPSNTDTVVQVLSGSCGALAEIACADDNGCGPTGFNSQVSASLTAGVTYYVRVCSWSSSSVSGTFGLNIVAPPPSLLVAATATPAAVFTGGTVVLTATLATSTGAPLTGSETVTANVSAIGGPAAQPMTSLGGGVYSLTRTAVGTTGTKTVSFNAAGGGLSGSASLTIAVSAIPQDLCAGAVTVVDGVNGPYSNVGALPSEEPGFVAPCATTTGGRDLFFRYVAPTAGAVIVSTCGGDPYNGLGVLGDTQLTAYAGWSCATPGALVACNDDAGVALCGVGGKESTITFLAAAGASYLLRVAGGAGAAGTFVLTIQSGRAAMTAVGVGCGGASPPVLAGSSPPILGSTGTLTMTGPPNAAGFLLFAPPNFAAAYTPIGTCTLYLAAEGLGILMPADLNGAGIWATSGTFPSDPAFAGLDLDLQGVFWTGVDLAFTNGLALVLGF
jgi:hypothetical protein